MANKIKELFENNFPKWYTTVILESQLADYGASKGTMIFRPYGFALWKNIQRYLGSMIEELGVEDVYFPLFFPYEFLSREAEHVEGFAPEVAIINYAGGKKLEKPLVIRPTSETVMYEAFSRWIKSYKDLPLKINQWANVVRWEKRTQFFLRTSEFLWQEGHTAHATKTEADDMVFKALNMYERFLQDVLAMYGIKGYKTDSEKFAGALFTTTIEALMKSRKALQSCTSHHLGQGFAKAFNVRFLDKNNKLNYVWQTSWGLSTRIIGGIIAQHGDKFGLKLPYKIAPIQIVIVPIYKSEKEKRIVIKFIQILEHILIGSGIRVFVDLDEDSTPGWKFNLWELKGVPLRVEIGPKEVAENKVTVFNRASRKRVKLIKNNKIGKEFLNLLDDYHADLLLEAKKFTEEHTYSVVSETELKDLLAVNKIGFFKVFFKDSEQIASYLQDKYKITPRVIPFDSYEELGNDFITGEKGARITLFAKAY